MGGRETWRSFWRFVIRALRVAVGNKTRRLVNYADAQGGALPLQQGRGGLSHRTRVVLQLPIKFIPTRNVSG